MHSARRGRLRRSDDTTAPRSANGPTRGAHPLGRCRARARHRGVVPGARARGQLVGVPELLVELELELELEVVVVLPQK